MKKVGLVLLMGLAIGMTFMSCSKEPTFECERIIGFEYEITEDDKYKIYTVTVHGTHITRMVGYGFFLEVVGGQHYEWCGERY